MIARTEKRPAPDPSGTQFGIRRAAQDVSQNQRL